MVKGKAARKPHGRGKQAVQRQRRGHLSHWLCSQLLEKMDLDSAESTGVLFPKPSGMKKRKHKLRFGFLGDVEGRVFTKKLCLLTCRKLVHRLPFRLNFDPRVDQEAFLEAQAARLKALARKAKRTAKEMAAADNDDTQPLVGAPVPERRYQKFTKTYILFLHISDVLVDLNLELHASKFQCRVSSVDPEEVFEEVIEVPQVPADRVRREAGHDHAHVVRLDVSRHKEKAMKKNMENAFELASAALGLVDSFMSTLFW